MSSFESLRELLLKMIAVPSVNSDIFAQREMAELLRGELESLGYEVKLLPIGEEPPDDERYIVLGEPRDGDGEKGKLPALLLYGHYDVVDSYGWGEAFQPRVEVRGEDEVVIGRGANDMKGGIASILYALKEHRRRFQATPPAKVIFVTDEEEWSKGAWALVRRYHQVFQGISLIVVPEMGVLSDKVTLIRGRRGRLTFRVTLKGIPYHGAQPHRGLNPIMRLPKLLEALRDFPLSHDPSMGLADSLTPLSVKTPSHQLTVPESLELIVDLHYTSQLLRSLSVEDPIDPIKALEVLPRWFESFLALRGLEGIEVSLLDRPTPFPPLWVEDLEDLMSLLSQVMSKHNLSFSCAESVADENVLSTLKVSYPNLRIVGISPVGGNSHSLGEWVSLRSLSLISEVLLELLSSFA